MEFVNLGVRDREGAGKGVARKLRAEGYVPAIYYGVGIDPRPFSVDKVELLNILKAEGGEHQLLNLEVEGESKVLLAVIKALQLDPVSDMVLHVDFQAVRMDRPITVDIPLILTGEPLGVEEGGMLEQRVMTLKISCLPKHMPSGIELDVSHLDVGDSITLQAVESPEGVTIEEDENLPLASIVMPRIALVEEVELELEELEEGEEIAEGEAEETEESEEES